VDLEGTYTIACNVSTFVTLIPIFQQGLAESTGADPTSVEILSYSISYDKGSRRLLAGSNSTDMMYRVQIARYWEKQALAGLEDGFNKWAELRGLPGAAVRFPARASCGAGQEPSNDTASNITETLRCITCPVGKYKSESNNSMCIQCPAHSWTPDRGAILLSQCVCKPSYYSNGPLFSSYFASSGSLLFNYSCHICGAGFYCPGDQQRIPCFPGSHTLPGVINYSSPCTLCPAGKYQNSSAAQNCSRCPQSSDSQQGNSLCSCLIGLIGPLGGPCLCKASSNRYLKVTVEQNDYDSSSLYVNNVTLRVYNTSSTGLTTPPQMCGKAGVVCVPFLVRYTAVDISLLLIFPFIGSDPSILTGALHPGRIRANKRKY
jgi:hypothetical protein